MRCATIVLVGFCLLFCGSGAGAQEVAAPPPQPEPLQPAALPPQPEILLPTGPLPEASYDLPPTLPSAGPRIGLLPALAPVADPRVIVFDPYFFPTHFNFRPLPYGYPPTEPGFFYGAFANPYYYQFYGPGDYYGF
jgi:hypothetical protein